MDREIEAIEPEFTTGDLVSEIEARFGISAEEKISPESLYTTRELEEIFCKSKDEIYAMLHRLKEDGLLDDTQRKTVITLGNRTNSVPAYRFKQKEEETNDQGSLYRR